MKIAIDTGSVADYATFLAKKAQVGTAQGFDPVWMPDILFPFQRHLVEWSVRRGRAALLADCGLGKSFMQIVWAENMRRKTNKPVLIATPLAVASQTVKEGGKLGIEVEHCRDGFHGSGLVVTNYELLHHFDPDNFAAMVCDESSILKSYNGATRKQITRFMSKLPYRLLCTATAAPNDYVELGTSSEALGELTHSEMIKRFFKMLDDKGQKKEQRDQDSAEAMIGSDESYYQKLAYRVAQTIGQWRLKHHAVIPFWRWVASWAKACRMPSDLGFADTGFILPKLIERDHVIRVKTAPDGYLFNIPAFGMGMERDERRRTLGERVEYVKELVSHNRQAVVWCHMNAEGDALEEAMPDAEQIAGCTPDDRKIQLYEAFANGSLRVLVIKPKIGAWGLNWQHCNHVVTFATHSYEQYYQSVRRCWRYGQKKDVRLDVVATDGEVRVLANMRRKSDKASKMFDALVREMNSSVRIERTNEYTNPQENPAWLS